MGCSESKIENVRTVNRCKERIAFMKQSITAHAAFVSANFAYTAALKNTSATLCDYAQSELQSLDDDRLPPSHPPLHRDGKLAWDFFVALMEDVRGPSLGVVDDKHGGGGVVKGSNSGGEVAEESGEGQGPPPSLMKEHMKNVNLVKVSRKLDGGFVKASDGACEVSKIHEANQLHYNSNLEDNKGQIKHSTRVIKVTNSAKLDFSSKEEETHATLMEKMLAWEMKLYDQVKAGEMMKREYQKKIALLNKQRKQGSSSDRLKQTEATVNDLHTRYIVEMQSIDSTVSEINRLRDEQLYPKLVQIVEEMGEMWKNMRKQHEHQLTIVKELSNIKISQLPKNTSEHNLKNIEQIHLHVTIWCSKFEKFMLHQKEYIKSLNNWLKVNLIAIDNNVKHQNPRIKLLLRTWRDQLEKLPEEGAKTAMNSLAAVIVTIVQYHLDEMKMKGRCEEIRRELTKKSREFEEWCDKQISKRISTDVMDDMDMIAEQQVVVEVLKMWLAEEEEAYRRHRVQVKDTSLMDLKTALPEFFTAMSEFASACSLMYGSLKSHSTGGGRRSKTKP